MTDRALANFSRKEIYLAENEISGLMTLRDCHADDQPLRWPDPDDPAWRTVGPTLLGVVTTTYAMLEAGKIKGRCTIVLPRSGAAAEELGLSVARRRRVIVSLENLLEKP